MFIRRGRCLTPTRRAHEKPFLDQIRLIHLLQGTRVFSDSRGDGRGAYRASIELVDERREDAVVHFVEPLAVHIQCIQCKLGDIRIDGPVALDFRNDVVETIANETTRPIAANKEKLADLFEAQAKAKKNQMDSLLTVLLSSKGQDDIYNVRNMQYTRAVEEYNEIRLLADQYALAVQQNMSGIEVIEYAYKAERKLKPVRSKICIATTMLAFILACLGAIGIEQVNYIKEELAKS